MRFLRWGFWGLMVVVSGGELVFVAGFVVVVDDE